MIDQLVNSKNRIIIQGATGREGQRAVKFMTAYRTSILAGVTPGKGGQTVENIPVFNSCLEVVSALGPIDGTSLYVPPLAMKSAATEAIEAGVKFIHILTEGIPYLDIAYILQLCQAHQVTLLGPGSLGMLVTDQGRICMIGGDDPAAIYRPGRLSIISRSGGMTNDIANFLSHNNIGIRAAIHLGSDVICGTSLADAVHWLINDAQTDKIVIFEEITYNNLTDLADYLAAHPTSKKIYLMVVGEKTLSAMPPKRSFGHVDVLIKKRLIDQDALKSIRDSGVVISSSYDKLLRFTNN